MSKPITCLALVACLATPEAAWAEEIVTISICLTSEKKPVPQVELHLITPQGNLFRTTDESGCVKWQIPAVATFDVALWYDGDFLGLRRGEPGQMSRTIPLDFDYLLARKDDKLRLLYFRAYIDTLKGHDKPIDPKVMKLLTGDKFRKDVDLLMTEPDSDLKPTKHFKEKLYKDIDNIKIKTD